MSQFFKILKFELKYFLKNKVFIGVTLSLVAIIGIVMFMPRVGEMIDFYGSEDVDTSAVMLVKADDKTVESLVNTAFGEAFVDYDVQVTSDDTETIKQMIIDGEAECAFVLSSATEYVYYVNNLSLYDANTATADSLLQNVYRMTMMLENGMTLEQTADIMSMQINSSTETLGKDQTENFFYTYIMIMALYMVIMLYGTMIATNVATEKSSRAMELLITSVKPVSMMFGKVISSCLAGLSQLVLIFGSTVLFYNMNKGYWDGFEIFDSLFNIPVSLLIYMLVFFMLGFFIYAFLYGALGSTATKLEDINTSVMPIQFLMIAAFFVSLFSMSSGEVDNMLIKVCSYIPFTSPMAMFTRIAMGSVAGYEIVICIAILLASTIGIGVIAAKIYRIGVVMYGTPPKLSSILKAIRKA